MTRFADAVRADGFDQRTVLGDWGEHSDIGRDWAAYASGLATGAFAMGCPVFDITAVAHAVADGLQLPVMPPQMRPPFDVLWAEFNLPAVWTSRSRPGTSQQTPAKIGGLVRTVDWDDRWTLKPTMATATVDELRAELAQLQQAIEEEDAEIHRLTGPAHHKGSTGALSLTARTSRDVPPGTVDMRTAQGAFDEETRRRLLAQGITPDVALGAIGLQNEEVIGWRDMTLAGGTPGMADDTPVDGLIADAKDHLAALEAKRAELLGRPGVVPGVEAVDEKFGGLVPGVGTTGRTTIVDELIGAAMERRDAYTRKIEVCRAAVAKLDELTAAGKADLDGRLRDRNESSWTARTVRQLETDISPGSEPRWLVLIDGYCHLIDGRNVAGMGQWAWALDEHGDPLANAYQTCPDDRHDYDRLSSGADRYTMLATVIALAMSLTNCRNVDQVEHHPPVKVQRARQRRDRLPLVSYRTIAIRPMTSRGSSSVRVSDEAGVRYHLRRGRFRDYRHGNGLFGRAELRRVFWFSSTMAGNPQRGRSDHDYEVEP